MQNAAVRAFRAATRTRRRALVTGFISLAVIGLLGGGGNPRTGGSPVAESPAPLVATAEPTEAATPEPTPQPTEASTVEPTPEQADSGTTVSQENAVRKAEEYISLTSFSAQGLAKQLEFEGFSPADSTFAVTHIAVDWNEQAAEKAQEYLGLTGFSRQGLIDQLVFDGFTNAQATYGVDQAGL